MNNKCRIIGVALLNVLLSISLTGCGGGGSNAGDTTAPSIPTNVTATASSRSQIDLTWTASSDNTAVTGYKIYKNGTYSKQVTSVSTSDTGLNASTQYCYTVSAYDAAGNESGQSNQVCALTQSLSQLTGKAIASGTYSSYALGLDNTVWSWGRNNWGQLGYDTNKVDSLYPLQVKDTNGEGILGNISAIDAGHGYSVALNNNGTLVAWGLNSSGQLGNHTYFSDTSMLPLPVIDNNDIPINNIVAISTGIEHALALKNDGTVMAWGDNYLCKRGISVATFGTPNQVIDLDNVVAVSAGWGHSLALKNDGTVWAWGDSNHGESGTGISGTLFGICPPQQARLINNQTLNNIIAIAAGGINSLALKNDGTVYGWGGLPNPSIIYDYSSNCSAYPMQVQGISNVIAIAIANQGVTVPTSYALKSDGTVWTWSGTCNSTKSPSKIDDATDVVSIKASGESVIFLKRDGTVWTSGKNSNGQLGNGTKIDSPISIQVYK